MNQLRQQVATLEQENGALWADLKACQRSPSSQAQVAELEKAYAVLQAEVRERYHCGQVLQGEAIIARELQGEAIIAREQERAAQERAAELAKANEALRRGVERLAEAGNINALLGSFLLEAITVTEASAGAVMDRVSGSEFQMRSLAESGVIEKTFDAHAPEAVFSEVTTRDPAGVFRQLAAGQVCCHEVDGYFASWFPESAAYHQQRGHQVIWNFPFRVGKEIAGYLAIAFREKRLPNQIMTETVQALGYQVSLALETLRLAEEAKQAAIIREQEQSAQERAAELERVNEALRQRDRLLSAVAQITQDLLEAENIDIAIPAALQVVGKAANMSRVLLFAERQDPVTRRLKHYVKHEWVTDGFSNHASVGLSVLDNEDFHTISQPLYAGQSTWRVMDDLPDVSQSQFKKLDIKSTGAVPIFIEGQYAGCVTFDDCVTPRHWTQQEMDVLTAAAESIGSALHRKELVDRLVAERLRAAQERAAELAKANEALKRSVGYLTTADSLQSFLTAVLQESIQASGAVTAALFVYNPSSNTLQMTALVLHGEVVDIATDPRTEIWRFPVPADTIPAWHRMGQKREIFWFDNDNPSPEPGQFLYLGTNS